MRALSVPSGARRLLKSIADEAEKLRLPTYVVGGCIRDWLLGRSEGGDIDLVCERDPRPLAERCALLLDGRVESFGQFGTLRVLGRLRVDFARSRREQYPKPAALPVVSPAPLEEDLFRRDFTINAMAAPLAAGGLLGDVVDPHGGLADLRAGRLRVLHERSFRDDPTRVFRAARFLCRFGFKPAAGLVESAQEALAQGHAALLSRHRLAQELLCILEEDEILGPLKTLKKWGYLDLIHPRLRPRAAASGATERLGALVLALGGEGEAFLRSLPVEHGVAVKVREALAVFAARQAPRAELSPEAVRILRCALPRLPKAALKPLLVDGKDLRAAGLPPGKGYGRILEAAAAAQWAGDFSTRPQALRWLGRRLA
jgi:tRNA nucleotidyltransferase (CCA-adding enzyme)